MTELAPSPVPQRSLAVRIVINAMSGAGTRVATMAIGFLLTPFIIHELGLAQYGLWAVVGSLAGYLGFLDFGLGGAFVKFISEFVERNDRASARQVVVFGMMFYAAFGLLLAAPILVFAPHIVHAFKMPAAQYGPAAQLLRVMFGLLIVAMILNVPGMVVVSMQRMDLASRNNYIGYLAYAGSTLLFLKLHYGIASLIIGQAVQITVSATAQITTAHRLFGILWHNPLRIERAILKRLFAFGGWTQVNSVFTIVNLDVGRFIAAGIVSVASVGLYEIASKIAFFAKIFPSYLLDALMPAAAAADARKDGTTLGRMYATGTRYSVFLTFASAGLLIGAADPLIRVWLGQSYPYVSTLILWLSLGYAANSLSGVGTTLLRAAGKPRYETYYTGLAMIVNLASTIPLARAFGIVGVAMGTTLGWFAGTLYFLYIYHRIRPSPWWSPIGGPALRLTIASALATAGLYFVVHVPAIEHCFTSRLLGLIVLGVASLAYFTVFVGLTIAFGVWRHDGPQLATRINALVVRVRRRLPVRLLGHRA